MIYYFLKNILHSTSATTTRELDICPWPDFSFVLGIFDPGTNEGICTSWIHRPVQMPPHKGASGPPTNAAHLYLVEPPPSTNVPTFVPAKKNIMYKSNSIDLTGRTKKNFCQRLSSYACLDRPP
jgi:hypothetical protein